MKYTTTIHIVIFLVAFMLMGCDMKKNKKIINDDKFSKIFDNRSYSNNYIPIDIQEAADGGFIILSATRIPQSSFYGIHILKTDKFGNFVSEKTLESQFVSPVYSLMKTNNEFFFFCMNNTNLETKLMKISQDMEITEVAQFSGMLYPLCASLDGLTGNLLLQFYNREERKTMLAMITTSGTITALQEFDIGVGDFDIEIPVVKHLTGRGPRIPFLISSTSTGKYFFNGFYNYTLSLVFFSFSNSQTAVLQGYRDERGISAATHIEANIYSLVRFSYQDNYIIPRIALNDVSGAISSSSDLAGLYANELEPNARVIVKKMDINGRNTIVYGSTTRTRQIGLYAYDAATGALLGSKYVGFSNPCELGSFISTADGGLAISGTTHLAGRLGKICLFKLNRNDLMELVQ
ncbi:MAG: hypothetical protein NZ529_02805 [Cytophagaceae bacterium]|nr:hypothetical protein [Cytophagaceae bacterium]MDW8455701.1 hypothetical protein [Cytophagaceae bacterium]